MWIFEECIICKNCKTRHIYFESYSLVGYFDECVHFWCSFCGFNTICFLKNNKLFRVFKFY